MSKLKIDQDEFNNWLKNRKSLFRSESVIIREGDIKTSKRLSFNLKGNSTFLVLLGDEVLYEGNEFFIAKHFYENYVRSLNNV